MSDRLHGGLQVGAAVLGFVAGVTGLFGAFVLLPSRMEAAERQIARLNDRDEKSREMLVRIEERLIQLQGELKRKTTL